MAESTLPATPSAGLALARRALFFALLGPATVGLGGKVQGGGGPSAASFIGALLGAGPARSEVLYLTVAVLTILAALALIPGKR